MNKNILAVIKQSIKHWEDNVCLAQKDALCISNISSTQCPLCNITRSKTGQVQCYDCPISKSVGEFGCTDTPWFYVNQMGKMSRQSLISYCLLELDFLWNIYYLEQTLQSEE